MWFIAVALLQVLPEGFVVVLAEVGAAQQAEVQDEEEAPEHSGIAEQGQGTAVHLYDGRTICKTESAGPEIQR